MAQQARTENSESELTRQVIMLIRSCGVTIDADMFFRLAFMTKPQLKDMLRQLCRDTATAASIEAR